MFSKELLRSKVAPNANLLDEDIVAFAFILPHIE